jgi:opacity protein-like surface antigen
MKKYLLAVLLMFASATATADNFFEVGADFMFYDGFTDNTSLSNNIVANARWGTLGNTGIYGWGSYEQPDVKFSGLEISKVKTPGVGVGLRVPLGETFYMFGEAGYYFPNPGKGIDVSFDNSWGGSAGAGFDLGDHWTIAAKYRYLKYDSRLYGNTAKSDQSAWTLGASFRF